MPLPEIVPGSLDGGTVGDAFGVSAVEDVDSEGIGDSFPFSAILDTDDSLKGGANDIFDASPIEEGGGVTDSFFPILPNPFFPMIVLDTDDSFRGGIHDVFDASSMEELLENGAIGGGGE